MMAISSEPRSPHPAPADIQVPSQTSGIGAVSRSLRSEGRVIVHAKEREKLGPGQR